MVYKFNYDGKAPFQSGHLNLGGISGGTQIEVTNRYLVRNQECWIPVMGEIHYSRVSCCDWKTELLKMKAGGITVISTYVIWIYHEEEEGVYDFQGNNDLKRFVRTVQECGLQMVLRIGPWVHGEVRNGGFPDWLLQKMCSLRTNDPEYLSYVKRFYEKIYEQVRSFLFDAGGPIFAIQIENELPHDAPHLLALKNLAMEVGLKAPVYTVTGWNARYGAEIPEYDVLPVFGAYPEATWEPHIEELEPSANYIFQPSRNDSAIGKDLLAEAEGQEDVFHMRYELYPFATCELGGGMQVTHHRRPVISGDDVAALALTKLGSGNNLPGYYMYHGGTNAVGKKSTFQESKASGYPNDLPIRSYDFQAPIGEFGQIRDQYRRLKLQHLFLKHFGHTLGKMDPFFQTPEIENAHDSTSMRYSLRTDGLSGYVFVNNYRRLHKLPEFRDVQFEAPADGGVTVFPENGITVRADAYFILPYHLDMDGKLLIYATAQLLARDDTTWFFFALDAIAPEYVFEERKYGGITPGVHSAVQINRMDGSAFRIVTLTQEQAEHFYELGDSIYISEGDMYEEEGKTVICREADSDLSYYRWENSDFIKHEHKVEPARVSVEAILMEEAAICGAEKTAICGRDFGESKLAGPGDRKLWNLEVQKEENAALEDVYLKIDYAGDMAQIYVEGVLAADDFNKGIPWMVSLKSLLRQGNKLELLICEKKGHEVYMEREGTEGLALKSIEAIMVYRDKNE